MGSPTAPTTNVRIAPKLDDTEQRLVFKLTAAIISGAGLAGTDWVTTTATQNGNWFLFHAVTDCVISSVTYASGTSTGSPAGLTLKAGDRIYGQILSLTLTSGSGELYRAAIG
jgi:hypothetical protein